MTKCFVWDWVDCMRSTTDYICGCYHLCFRPASHIWLEELSNVRWWQVCWGGWGGLIDLLLWWKSISCHLDPSKWETPISPEHTRCPHRTQPSGTFWCVVRGRFRARGGGMLLVSPYGWLPPKIPKSVVTQTISVRLRRQSTRLMWEDLSRHKHHNYCLTRLMWEDLSTRLMWEDLSTRLMWEDLSTRLMWEDQSTRLMWEDLSTRLMWEDLSTRLMWEDLSTRLMWEDLSTRLMWEDLSRHKHHNYCLRA